MLEPVGPKSILVVDDDPDILFMLQALFEEEGYRVRAEQSGDVIDHLSSDNLPDVFVLDLLISGTDGRDLARRLKQREETKHIPILILSAHPSAERHARAAGADDFIAKPFAIDVLLTRVRKAVNHEL